MATLVLLLIGVVFILIGINTIRKMEAKITIQLWSWGDDDSSTSRRGGSSESVHKGFVAFLIGLLQMVLGGAAIVQAFTKH